MAECLGCVNINNACDKCRPRLEALISRHFPAQLKRVPSYRHDTVQGTSDVSRATYNSAVTCFRADPPSGSDWEADPNEPSDLRAKIDKAMKQ